MSAHLSTLRDVQSVRAAVDISPVKWIVAIGIVVLGAWVWQHEAHVADERALAAVADDVSGREVGVQCQGFFSELLDIRDRAGDVPFPRGAAPDHTYLTRSTCRALKRFRTHSTHPDVDCLLAVDWRSYSALRDGASPCVRRAWSSAQAINTLTHEAIHLRGYVDEAQTQCYAIQTDAWAVERLGGTAAEGIAVASLVLASQPLLPTEYQSSACHAGGSLDLHPETPAFPTENPPLPPPAGLYGPALRR
jgi:hypothetical protein